MQYLVRQDTTVSMDTFKSESKNVVLRGVERVPSAASSPLHYRRSRAFSTNTSNNSSFPSELSSIVSLPTCNSSSSLMSPYSPGPNTPRSGSPTPSSTSSTVTLTGPVTLTAFLKRRPSNASVFRYPSLSPVRRAESLSGSTSSLNESVGASSRGVNKSASFLSPFKNMDDVRKSFRQGVKQMWNGYPKNYNGNKQ